MKAVGEKKRKRKKKRLKDKNDETHTSVVFFQMLSATLIDED